VDLTICTGAIKVLRLDYYVD